MKTLIVLLGPTAVGKTELSLTLAKNLHSPILSADSRQIYREIPICTAAPTPEQLAQVEHRFVATHGLEDASSAAQFEADVVRYMTEEAGEWTVMTGGSMMYIDAVVKGIDDMPQADPEIRARLKAQVEAEGLSPLLEQLRELDPIYYNKVDRENPQRVVHGLEMCLTTGRPFSSFRTGKVKPRDFRIIQIGLRRDRAELYARIDQRVKMMWEEGLEAETRCVYEKYADILHDQLKGVVRNPGPTQAQPIPNLVPPALNTVGLKEMLLYFEGIYTKERALERICHNSHIYSKKQMTWFNRDDSIYWTSPDILSCELGNQEPERLIETIIAGEK